ncbi:MULTISPECIES: 2OG-Fe(II) oxygenase [unclassified Streptomyces]|uniref:prolyl hydroxylase family protein n=1 Tax=unclassified Streptomyces TaxID=2593676 RepID=UPI000DD54A39|nr:MULTISPECIES: 2OG-Fe(II) oxygenase [unclassified Streptomyces]QZZ31026.1 2OG-Fe(II) oxygenase [Streptomyces sp. ST1015]
MSLVDIDTISRAELEQDPFGHAVIPRSFVTDAVAERLRGEFSDAGFEESQRTDVNRSDKQYRMFNRSLVAAGAVDRDQVGALPASWQQLVEDVVSRPYRAALSALTGVDLDACLVEARMTRYARGCWIEPHTDRPDKAVTHLFYFNDGWDARWSGDLRLLRSADMADCAKRVAPTTGTSVVLVRSDRSWHGVPPVADSCPVDRRALLVHFVRP